MTIAQVFVNEQGNYGNPVGIVVDEALDFDPTTRQQIAFDSGFSEVVFIDNLKDRSIHIFSPTREIPFAGHAVIGTAYFLRSQSDVSIETINGVEGPIATWIEDDLTWVSCSQTILPPWELVQHTLVKKVESIRADEISPDAHAMHWAWIDKPKGIIRACTFAPAWGIKEDEANGSGSMRLAANLDRAITVTHGKGSLIYALPAKNNAAKVGGRVKLA